MSFSPQQEEALKAVRAWRRASNAPQVFYLAGWAGTGKTTLAKTLAAEEDKVYFAAFTGKAALVLQGKGCANASTIHSLIYRVEDGDGEGGSPGEPKFRLDPESKARKADLIVIDEVSMVGEELGRDLLSFGTPVLVLGDPAQLPPVAGAGFFTARQPNYTLTEIHRQAADNPIIAMSKIVREGGRLELGAYGESRIIRRDALGQKAVLGADQVLVGLNKTRSSLNTRIRGLLGRTGWFAADDRVVCLKNDKELGLLNGGLWTVDEVEYQDATETHMGVMPLDAGVKRKRPLEVRVNHAVAAGTLKPEEGPRGFQAFDFGYALTCHKAQGSQWNDVIVFDESFAFREDRARWLYTAITRAAERVTVVL